MQDNEFYKGVLFELEKLAAPSTSPTVQPTDTNITAPASSPSTLPPANASSPSTLPPANASAPTQFIPGNRFRDVKTNISAIFLPKIQQGLQGVPLTQWGSTLNKWINELNTVQDTLKLKGNPIFNASNEYLQANPSAGLVSNLKDIQTLGKAFEGFDEEDLRQRAADLRAWGDKDPAAKDFSNSMSRGAVDATINPMGWKDILNTITGKQDPAIQGILEDDSNLKEYATNKVMSHVGELSGKFLTDNWGKIAGVVGGGAALIALLKNLMSDNEEKKQQQQRPIVNAPTFF